MTARIRENQLKAVLFIILFIILMARSLSTQAQANRDGHLYRGFVASFGTRSVSVTSDLEKIDQTNLMAAGGQVGLICGNDALRAKVGLLGYYTSTGNTPGSTDLYQSNLALNFYPLSMISDKDFLIEPYFTAGASYDQFKFFGYYINQEPGLTNYSQAEAPFLGKIKEINATAGLGIELKLKDRFNFIHLFSEVKFGRNMSRKTAYKAFEGTSLTDQMHVAVGLTFGAHH